MTTKKRLKRLELDLSMFTKAPAPAATTRKKSGTNSFIIINKDKERCAVLAFGENGPFLSLFEESGSKSRAGLNVGENGPWLALLDERGKVLAKRKVAKDGPVLVLLDKNGKRRAILAYKGEGEPYWPKDEKAT
ncbi:MAG: hypothetical protein PHE84_01775 [bacterium]|nr:hypothetical protein [bacterium]